MTSQYTHPGEELQLNFNGTSTPTKNITAAHSASSSLPPLYSSHRDDLAKSGLTDATVAAMQIKSYDRNGLVSLLGRTDLASQENGYVIPYLTKEGKPTEQFNVRLLQGLPHIDKPEKRLKYLKPAGTCATLYWPPGCAALIEKLQYCIVTEGEKKAAKAVQEGFPCVAIGGVYNWTERSENGAERKLGDGVNFSTKPLPDLLELGNSVPLILLFDSDASSNRHVKDALRKLHDALLFHGAKWVRRLEMPVPDGWTENMKIGLDDLLITQGGSQLLFECIEKCREGNGTAISPLAKIKYATGTTQDLHYIIPNSTPTDQHDRHVIWQERELDEDDHRSVVLTCAARTRVWCSKIIQAIESSDTWYEVGMVPLGGRIPIYRIGDKSLLSPNGRDDRYGEWGASILPKERNAVAEVLHACQTSGYAKKVPGTLARGWIKPDSSHPSHVYVMPHGVMTLEGFFSRDSRRCPLVPIPRSGDSDDPMCYGLRKKGDIKEGATTLFQEVLPHVLPAVMCSAAVAGLLRFALPESENFVVHLYGQSSDGKTTALTAAASMFGNPNELRKQWRTTDNGLEAALAARNDLAIFLDESGQQADQEILNNAAYLISNGTSKSRARRDASERRTDRFRLVALSTGEHTLLKGEINGGQEVRVLQLASDLYGRLWGETTSARIEQLGRKLMDHYGWALEPLIREIQSHEHDGFASLQNEMKIYLGKYREKLGDNPPPTALRRAKHLAVLTVAYRLLSTVCLKVTDTPNMKDMVLDRLGKFIAQVKHKMLILDSDQFNEGESRKIIRYFYEQLICQQSKIYGMTEGLRATECLGYKVGDYVGVLPIKLNTLISPYDKTRLLRALDSVGLLVLTPNERTKRDFKHSIRIGPGNPLHLHVVRYSELQQYAGT